MLNTTFSEAHGLSVPSLDGFKAQAQQFKHALAERQVPVKLADVHEAMARSLGFADYATYRGLLNQAQGRVVTLAELNAMDAEGGRYLIYVAEGSLDHPVTGEHCEVEEIGDLFIDPESFRRTQAFKNHPEHYPEDPLRMNDTVGKRDGLQWVFDEDGAYIHGVNTTLSPADYEAMVVTGVFCRHPRSDRYGLPYLADDELRVARVQELFSFRCYEFAEADMWDTGDDSCGLTLLEVFVPNALAQRILAD